MIVMEHVKKSFGKTTILEDISFTIEKGTKVSLLGPGGCGKSTILKLLLGLEPPDQGEIQLFGRDMVRATEEEKQRTLRNVGMAFQHGALFDYMTVAENLIFAMEHMTEFTAEQWDQRIDMLLKTVKLSRTKTMFPYELSGGMQRRIGIARALATDPKVAIFDEPTSGLDPVTSTIILNMINELGKIETGNSLLVSTSSVEVAIVFSDRVIMVNQGRVVADGPWRELLLTGPDWVRHFLGVRLIGIDLEYAHRLGLPQEFIRQHWH